jgi:serine/threonine protein kinase
MQQMRIGRFEIDPERRKEGGQAFVYLTVDPVTGADVAVKVARPSSWSRKRMKAEIKTQEAMSHENILPVLARDRDYAWYAAQRAECSLEEFGQFAPANWMYLRAGLLGVASAVAYAHSQGYVHRDLSSGNVLIFAHGWAVADWGFVYVPSVTGPRMTQPLERFGTPEFMAPEMAIDPMDVGPAADVFSIGRLAAWATGLKRGESAQNDDATVRWWRLLIDSTTAYEPSARWTMRDVETHLRSTVARNSHFGPKFTGPLSAQAREICPRCSSTLGRDRAERCLSCHAVLAY